MGKPAQPGDFVSIDQMVTGSPGLIPFTSGHPSRQCYNMVTMWVDHFSRFLFAHCQEDATMQSTLESKISFESYAKKYNITVHHVHRDNGIFTIKAFKENVESSNQTHSFCGVGAHWQNGVIECFIGVITTRVVLPRTMLLHAMDMWPDVISSEFWSFAFMHAVHLHNCTPHHSETQSPFTKFTNEDPLVMPHDLSVHRFMFSMQHYNLDPSDLANGRTVVIKVYTSGITVVS